MTGCLIRKKIAKEWMQPRQAEFVTYDNARRIAVLVDAEGAESLQTLVETWEKEGRKVTWVVFAKKKETVSLKGDILYINPRFLSCMALPRKSKIRQFDDISPDVLIDLTFSRIAPLSFLAARSKALMKIGVIDNVSIQSYYDLSVCYTVPTDAATLLQNIISYWNKVKCL